jgi:hypothetical protein
MIRSATLVAIGGLAALSSIEAVAADPLPTETFKVLPATLAVEAAEAATLRARGKATTFPSQLWTVPAISSSFSSATARVR